MAFWTGLWMLGCFGGGEDSGTGPVDTATADQVTLDGACPLVERLGGFVLQSYESYTIIDGSVADGVIPITVLTESTTKDECTLWVKPNPFCDPPCESGDICDLDDTCIPYPETQDLGTVTMTGLEIEVSMEPVSPGYSYFHTSLPHPAVQPGALVTLFTGGGAYDPVKLHGFGVEDMVPLDDQWMLYATVFCLFEDDGEAVVPSVLIDELIGAGVTGFPSGALERSTSDRTSLVEGCMDFEVSSPRVVDMRVDGFVPCTSNRDCPDGLECNLEIQICE